MFKLLLVDSFVDRFMILQNSLCDEFRPELVSTLPKYIDYLTDNADISLIILGGHFLDIADDNEIVAELLVDFINRGVVNRGPWVLVHSATKQANVCYNHLLQYSKLFAYVGFVKDFWTQRNINQHINETALGYLIKCSTKL